MSDGLTNTQPHDPARIIQSSADRTVMDLMFRSVQELHGRHLEMQAAQKPPQGDLELFEEARPEVSPVADASSTSPLALEESLVNLLDQSQLGQRV